MKKNIYTYFYCILFLACSHLFLTSCSTLASAGTSQKFEPLFNGKNLSGWHGNNPHTTAKAKDKKASLDKQAGEFAKHWSVENGELVNDGKGPFATSDKGYGDFELMLEYKTVSHADSGIYLRGNPQVQIWDTSKAGGKWEAGADKGSGGLWNNAKGSLGKDPLVHADLPFGEWNKVKLRLLGSRTWVWLNDKLVVDGAIMKNYWSEDAPLIARGPIHLQTHGGEIRWRNIMIREIGGEEANQILSKRNKSGFKSMFNGKDYTDWQGGTKQYTITNGEINSNGDKHLYTQKEYSDFEWHLEFKVIPGGNNGLAIRYPGKGNPAYVGMCELQVLDNTAKKYAELKPYQYHGSVYAQKAAARGYQRPVGEWNYQEVRVEGTKIYVELNGTPITSTDVAKLKTYKAGKFKNGHPGKGYLGFAGHGPGASFRNLWIKEL